jgi:polysaccharide deacetylase family protein (PEP-CTERM system associated)
MKENKFTLSIDWEDFGQIMARDFYQTITPPALDLDRQTNIILDILAETNSKATFFVLGMCAKYRPQLVKKIADAGHEIGIHGTNHVAMTKLDRSSCFQDLSESIKIVTDIISQPIFGYRAPYFSIQKENLFVLELLTELGIEYDSSIYPAKTLRYGIADFHPENQLYKLPNGHEIVELPLTIFEFRGKKLPVSGGGYFRAMPDFLIQKVYEKLKIKGRAANIYMHPYEFDTQSIDIGSNFLKNNDFPAHKRMILNLRWNFFRQSIRGKVTHLLNKFDFITCKNQSDYVKNNTNSPILLGRP